MQLTRVLLASAECAPLTQVGGLGDVVGALPPALAATGLDVKVALPLYPFLRHGKLELTEEMTFPVPYDGKRWKVRLYSAVLPGNRTPLLLFGQGHWIASLYKGKHDRFGYSRQHLRFGFFCAALASWLEHTAWTPDVIHCHDHHTGLLPVMLAGRKRRPRIVLTIHNAEHQGSFHADGLKKSPSRIDSGQGPLPKPSSTRGRFLNFLKRGVRSADLVTTVSPTYARELTTPEGGHGLEADFARRFAQKKLVGVINGIDVTRWNPRTDPNLPARYGATTLARRATIKAKLQRELSLPRRPDVFLLVMVARLARQKGILLVLSALQELLQRDLQLVICGDGPDMLVEPLSGLSAYAPKQLAYAPFSSVGESLCYGGGDAFFMPSKFEPCGLTQMKAMRYGCVPVVRATGGLRDTVVDARLHPQSGTGFLFRDYTVAGLLGGIDAARTAWTDTRAWRAIQRRGMSQDFSWSASAQTYRRLYQQALRGRED